MRISRYLGRFTVIATAVGVGLWAAGGRTSLARGGHGGGEHGGEHHAEEHYAEHHEEHHAEHHEGEHHEARHEEHHDDHHWNHHYHDWNYAGWGWGPGFWGGAAVGYGLGAWGGWAGGGDTYIDNSDSGNAAYNSTPLADTATSEDVRNQFDPSNQADNTADQTTDGNVAGTPPKLPVDVWPELGISTFTGHKDNETGLVVVRVKRKSAGQQAGLVPGDVILKFNGQPTTSDETLETLLESTKGPFELSVLDANTGKERTITGQLGQPNAAN